MGDSSHGDTDKVINFIGNRVFFNNNKNWKYSSGDILNIQLAKRAKN